MSGGVLRRPAVPPPVRIRRDINSLAVTDPIVVGYNRAIARMKTRRLDEPTSWRYQGAIHDYPFPDSSDDLRRNPRDGQNRPIAGDPNTVNGEALPSDRGTFWRACQHNSWFFLPWHRMYLHHFEQMILALVIEDGGPRDWALPYWKWTGPEGDGRLPVAFREVARGGLANLFIPQRAPAANRGERFANDQEMDKTFDCLSPSVYLGIGQFGGPPVRRHGGRGPAEVIAPALNGFGGIEGTPHGSMHVAVGGAGFMSNFVQAALDPIFWLHHCNIDRLWEVWVQRAAVNRNPDDVRWLDEQFSFHNATGGTTNMKPRDVLNTRRAPLSYEYDDTTDPVAGP